MKNEEKTHWKKNFNYDYLGAYSLKEGQEITLTIKTISKEMVVGSGGSKEECTIVKFKESVNGESKPMILNKTNCKIIEKLYGTPYIDDWAGKKVTIFVQENIKAFGDLVDALRIKSIKPVTKKPLLNPESSKWETAKTRVLEGMTFEEISKHYDISKENYQLLCS